MSDSDRSHDAIGQAFKAHRKVNHARKQFVAPGGVHVNTAESFGAQLERAQIGVFHWISPKHLQRGACPRAGVAGPVGGRDRVPLEPARAEGAGLP